MSTHGRALIIRAEASRLPLPDESVDLIVTSPPYWKLRAYTDGGAHYDGQIGSEPAWQEYLAALLDITRECVRVLKPSGSLFVDLGDVYRDKSLLLLPERYRIGCVDELGLLARAVIVWHKKNPLPESAGDRVRRDHEDWVHLTKSPRYFAAVDELREPHVDPRKAMTWEQRRAAGEPGRLGEQRRGRRADHRFAVSPLGKLPGSVWTIPSEPLTVPPELGVDHFAAFPTAWPVRLIQGWSPSGICTACNQGRRPAVTSVRTLDGQPREDLPAWAPPDAPLRTPNGVGHWRFGTDRRLTGYACACTPHTDHPGTGAPSGPYGRHAAAVEAGTYENVGQGWAPTASGHGGLGDRPRVGPWREYHFDAWTPPPTRPSVILDPFGGTGTTALAAVALGRVGVSVDLSHDYGRLARWRTTDRGELARVLGLPKPRKPATGQLDLDLGLSEPA